MSMEWIRFLLTTVFVLAGLTVCCIGVYGMFRFNYAANRMHAAATIDTMGIALTCVGFAISAPDVFTAMKILLVVVFWWLSSPVSSHLLCRLEIITDEQRDEYMIVHKGSIEQEREAAAHAGEAAKEADGTNAGEAASEEAASEGDGQADEEKPEDETAPQGTEGKAEEVQEK